MNQTLVAKQIRLGIADAPSVVYSLAANMAGLEKPIDRDGKVIAYSRINRKTLQAWSPFQQGFFAGVFVDGERNFPELNRVLVELSGKYEVSLSAIAHAWIARHPAKIQVVLGTTSPERPGDIAPGVDITRACASGSRLRQLRRLSHGTACDVEIDKARPDVGRPLS